MKKIISPTASGKTTELIKISSKLWHYIICRNSVARESIVQQAKEMGLDIPFPITYRESQVTETKGKWVKGYLLDDADEFLQTVFKGKVSVISMTGDNTIEHEINEDIGSRYLDDLKGQK